MKKLLRWFGLLALLAFIAGVAAVFNPFSAEPTPEVVDTPPVAVDRIQRDVMLYFGDPNSPFLVQEERPIDECDQDLDCIEAIVNALIAGPQTDLIPVLPPQALLLGVEINEDTVTLNFNKALPTNQPLGSSSELLTVHALVDTLAANFPYVRRLTLQVDGVAVETLGGHVDLREPVAADFSLVKRELDVPVVEELPVQEEGQSHE